MKNKKGFTLIELLIVIGVLGILAGIILVAVDPAKRLQQSRDARRSSEVNALLNAILNYTVDNKGTVPSVLSTATSTGDSLRVQFGTAGNGTVSGTGTCAINCGGGGTAVDNCVDLTSDLVDEYIAEMPIDPEGTDGTTAYDSTRTGYYVIKTPNGRIEVGSCNAEIESSIKIKR